MLICTISISDLSTWPRVRSVCKVKVSMLVYTSFPLFDMHINHIQIKMFRPFDPTPRRSVCLHVAAFVIPLNLIFNTVMFWKSWILAFWPIPGSTEGVYAKIVATILIHASFPLIRYATGPYSEKDDFWFLPHIRCWAETKLQLFQSWGVPSASNYNLVWYVSYLLSIVPLSACEISVKAIDNWLSYCRANKEWQLRHTLFRNA